MAEVLSLELKEEPETMAHEKQQCAGIHGAVRTGGNMEEPEVY